MTKEEIRQAAQEEFVHQLEIGSNSPLEMQEGFIKGAEWMQEKMQESNEGKALLYAVEKTAERTKREMIEKACEWLYVYYPTLEKSKSFEDAWKHFKQAMED